MDYHKPVMLHESVEGLEIKPDGVYVDCTFGGGGHSLEILKKLKTGKLIAFDQDPDVKGNLPEQANFLFANANFRFLSNFLQWFEIQSIDGILADLGVSWHHFDEAERGFSFRFDGDLDMRMNRSGGQTAAGIVATATEEDLMRMFREYGEMPEARKLARAISQARIKKPVATVQDLVEAVSAFIPRKEEHRFLARVFQSLRMEVNQETNCLRDLLVQIPGWLKPGGRMVFITYHSLEDRMVKNFIKTGKTEGELEKDLYGHSSVPLRAVNRKVVIPGKEEMEMNSRARSAKLRIAEKV
jgi:16S rRNA (cytosine1402-N4)-methyltransferase